MMKSSQSQDQDSDREQREAATEEKEAGKREAVTFHTQDAFRLKGMLFGDPATARMAVVLHGATGVQCGYYALFASWLARNHNAMVLTYDYRDFGLSAERPTRLSNARFSDWGILDQEAALAFLIARCPCLPMRVVGHSLGAQWLAFHRDIAKVDRVVAVAAGPAYWLDHPLNYMPQIIWFWWLAGPLTAKLFGYLPGWLGLGTDLPYNVFMQWRRFCVSPRFAEPDWGKSLPVPQPDQARFQLTLLPVSDDVMIPPKVVRRLARFYPAATITEDLIDPKQHGLKGIGHLRLFAPRSRAFWPRIAAPLVA